MSFDYCNLSQSQKYDDITLYGPADPLVQIPIADKVNDDNRNIVCC